jgi:hypothetical protein
LNDLTHLILSLNRLVDAELHQGITIPEVQRRTRNGDVFDWLRARFGSDFAYEGSNDPNSAEDIVRGLQALCSDFAGSEKRKWGVSNNGICLLIAWVNELVQRREWVEGIAFA